MGTSATCRLRLAARVFGKNGVVSTIHDSSCAPIASASAKITEAITNDMDDPMYFRFYVGTDTVGNRWIVKREWPHVGAHGAIVGMRR